MSAYSMPLCTILTKWPAPSAPMCVQHGSPSTLAEMSSNSGPRDSYDSFEPPGMMLGPCSAPSSPPETPLPTKCSPRSRSDFSRRRVSAKCALPASMITSPSSSSGANSSMTASVGSPAFTMITTCRGRSSASTNACAEYAGMKSPSSPNWSTSARVRSSDRLCRATVCPCRARLRARLRPMTARPVTPMLAFLLIRILSKTLSIQTLVRSTPQGRARRSSSLSSGEAADRAPVDRDHVRHGGDQVDLRAPLGAVQLGVRAVQVAGQPLLLAQRRELAQVRLLGDLQRRQPGGLPALGRLLDEPQVAVDALHHREVARAAVAGQDHGRLEFPDDVQPGAPAGHRAHQRERAAAVEHQVTGVQHALLGQPDQDVVGGVRGVAGVDQLEGEVARVHGQPVVEHDLRRP